MRRWVPTVIASLAAFLAASPSFALYKVVGPDGKVTYTDRPPSTEANKVSSMRPGQGGTTPADSNLPFELRQLVQRYPVTLYSGSDCVPCDSGRTLLQQRGIPYTEKRLVTEEDGRAYEQLGAGRTLPGLSIGSQQVRGLNIGEWTSYLDLAGYPKESRLPRNWKTPAATPLVEVKPPPKAEAAPADEAPPPRRATAPAPAPAAGPTPGIRF